MICAARNTAITMSVLGVRGDGGWVWQVEVAVGEVEVGCGR